MKKNLFTGRDIMVNQFEISDYWNERYQSSDNLYGYLPNDFLKENIHLFEPGSQVLSLAEGEGRNAIFLAQKKCLVKGVDFSERAKQKAQSIANDHNVGIDYEVADLSDYKIRNSEWDAVISIFCHLGPDARSKVLNNVKNGLKPQGIFLLESYNVGQLKYRTGGPSAPTHLVSLDELVGVFQDFEIIVAQETERSVIEGTGHTGLASVTQFIARKNE